MYVRPNSSLARRAANSCRCGPPARSCRVFPTRDPSVRRPAFDGRRDLMTQRLEHPSAVVQGRLGDVGLHHREGEVGRVADAQSRLGSASARSASRGTRCRGVAACSDRSGDGTAAHLIELKNAPSSTVLVSGPVRPRCRRRTSCCERPARNAAERGLEAERHRYEAGGDANRASTVAGGDQRTARQPAMAAPRSRRSNRQACTCRFQGERVTPYTRFLVIAVQPNSGALVLHD